MIAKGKRTKIRYPDQLKMAKALNLSSSELQSVLFTTANSSNPPSPLSTKRNPGSFFSQETYELFYTLLEDALLALHANNIPEFESISTNLIAKIPDAIPLKSNYISWYTALTLSWSNRFDPALTELEKAAQFKTSNPIEKTFKAKIIGGIGSVQVALGNYEEALKAFKKSVLVCKNGEQAAVIYLNIGSLYLRKRDFSLSLNAYEKALALSASQLKLLVYSGLGQLAMDQHNFPLARKYLLTGYCLASSLTNDLHKGDVFCNLGKYYKELMRYTFALRMLNKGLEYARKSSIKRTMLYILVEISDVHLLQNDIHGFNEIVSVIQSEVSADGDYQLLGALLIVLAEQHIYAHRYEQALLHLESSYRLLVDKSPTKELLTCCLLLKKIHSYAKRSQEAFFFDREVKRIKMQLAL